MKVQTTATATSQKHSWRPPGATSQARTSASAYVIAVNTQVCPTVSRPLGSGRVGLFTRSMSRS